KLTQLLISFAFASLAIGTLVRGKTLLVAGRVRESRCLGVKFCGVLMIIVLLFVKAGQRLVKLQAVRIIFYPAFEEIFAQGKIFALSLHPQREAWLAFIIHRGHRGVPSHVPCRHVPKQDHARLKRGDLPEQQQYTPPFCPLPGHMRLNEKSIGDDCPKSAQSRDETELAKFFAKIEIKFHAPEMFLPVERCEVAFNWHFKGSEHDQDHDHENGADHNSFP